MRVNFNIKYPIDATVGELVTNYCDCEHYCFAHRRYEANYQLLSILPDEVRQKVDLKYMFFRSTQTWSTKYIEPATLIMHTLLDNKRSLLGIRIPTIFSVISLKQNYRRLENTQDLKGLTIVKRLYSSVGDTGNASISEVDYEIEVPRFLVFLVPFIRRTLISLKLAKDLEDLKMIARRRRLFGINRINVFFKKNQFLLFKSLVERNFKDGMASN